MFLAQKRELGEPDKTVLTLTLRDDVKFTDGTKFTAAIAAQHPLRFKKGTSPHASFLVNLQDAVRVIAASGATFPR